MRARIMILLVAVLALVALGLLAGCGDDNGTTSGDTATTLGTETTAPGETGTTATTIGGAAALFSQNCASCHGANGEGGTGPALKDLGPTLEEERIETQIKQGGGGMPAFEGQLTDEQISMLADYVKAGVK